MKILGFLMKVARMFTKKITRGGYFDTQRIIILAIVLLLPTCAFCTTPVITAVSGIIATGQIVEVAGSNMLDEDRTHWAAAYKSGTKYGFEGSGYFSDGYDEAPDYNPQERAYDSNIFLMGVKSFRGRIYGTSGACVEGTGNHSAGLYTTLSSDGINGQDIYVRLYSRWKSTGSLSKWPSSHIKMLDVQGTGVQLYLQPHAGDNLPNQMNMGFNSETHLYTVDNFLQEDRWYCMEARFKWSAPTNFTAWVDGVLLASHDNVSVGNYQYVLFNIINACGFSDLDLTNWTDGFTISTNRIFPASKIEISNNVNYSSGVVKQQEPVYLSDGTIRFRVTLSGLGSGPYYLWITNNRQERSAAFDLQAHAETPDTSPPAAPTGLKVN